MYPCMNALCYLGISYMTLVWEKLLGTPSQVSWSLPHSGNNMTGGLDCLSLRGACGPDYQVSNLVTEMIISTCIYLSVGHYVLMMLVYQELPYSGNFRWYKISQKCLQTKWLIPICMHLHHFPPCSFFSQFIFSPINLQKSQKIAPSENFPLHNTLQSYCSCRVIPGNMWY